MRLFFNLVPSRLEDLDLHGLPAQRALQLLDALLRSLELRDRHHILIGGYCDASTAGNSPLPVLQERRLYAQLTAQLSGRDLATRDTANCLLLELGAE